MSWTRRAAALSLMLTATDPAPSRADEFEDFRIPPHRALLWSASLLASGSRNQQSDGVAEYKSGRVGGNAGTQWFWYYDSDPSYLSLSAAGSVGGTRNRTTDHLAYSTPVPTTYRREEEGRQRAMDEAFSVSLAHRRYPWAIPIGGSITAAGGGLYAQRWRTDDTEIEEFVPFSSRLQVSNLSEETWQYSTYFSGAASVVFGRVRDATAVYEVMVLEQRLAEAGVIGRALSPAARQRLVAITYERYAVSGIRERPARTVWDAIERVLRDDGALADGGLDGRSIFRAVEPYFGRSVGVDVTGLPRSPLLRLRGASIGPVFRYRQGHFVSRLDVSQFNQVTLDGVVQPPFESSTHDRSDNSLDEPEGGLEATYHRPFGPEWQLDLTGLLAIPLSDHELGLATVESAALSYLIADRWQAQAVILHQWNDETRTAGPTPGDLWFWQYGVTARYYLEDRTSLQLTFSERQDWFRGVPVTDPFMNGPAHQYRRSGELNLALAYRFSGWFDAPAFPPLERP